MDKSRVHGAGSVAPTQFFLSQEQKMTTRSKTIVAGCSLALATALQSGCATTQKAAEPMVKTPPPLTQATQEPAPQILAGKVVETMNSGGYTYVHLEKDGKKTWVAVPPMEVKVGQEIKLRPGMDMGKFTSNTLKRTFDDIVFSSGPETDTAPQAPANAPKADQNAKLPEGHPAIGQQAKIDAISQSMPAGHKMMGGKEAEGTISGKIVETMDGGGYTYVCLEKGGKKTWAAIPTTHVAVGEELQLAAGTAMTNFSSKTLNRTFDSIIFSSGPVAK
jgi:hypothetical protein